MQWSPLVSFPQSEPIVSIICVVLSLSFPASTTLYKWAEQAINQHFSLEMHKAFMQTKILSRNVHSSKESNTSL